MNSSKAKEKRFWHRWRMSGALEAILPLSTPAASVKTIGWLPGISARRAVYKRADGRIFLKLNERFHVAIRLSDDGESWLGDGCVEAFHPKERVEAILY